MLTFYRFDGGPIWSEALPLVPGLVGAGFILRGRLPRGCDLGFSRFILFYTLLMTAVYSAISYKTPWCILSFLNGWILLAGIGIASIVGLIKRGRMPRLQSGVLLALLIIPAIATYRLAHRTVFRYAADYHNPYVYAHTSPDFMNLVNRIHELEAVSLRDQDLYIQVLADPDSTWPLPFYLRNNHNTGYWPDAESIPDVLKPDIVISSPDYTPDEKNYLSELYGLRPDTLLAIHIERSLWDAFIETRK
jgi:predicted membrane-bound mannosyltransferase